METDNLNIFNPIWYYGSNFEFVDDPINHKSIAKLILFDATVQGHSMQEVIAAIMDRAKHVITKIDYDSNGTPVKFIVPTTAQQYASMEKYHQKNKLLMICTTNINLVNLNGTAKVKMRYAALIWNWYMVVI